MRREGAGDGAIVVAVATPLERTGLDFGRQMTFFQREQAAGMKNNVGVGDAAVLGDRSRRIRQLAAEAAEQGAAGVMFSLPLWGADPAVAITGAATLEMEGVQHAVADEPVRAPRLALTIGAVAIKRAVEFAGQFAHDLQKRCVAFHWYRRQIGPGRSGRRLLLHRSLPSIIFTS